MRDGRWCRTLCISLGVEDSATVLIDYESGPRGIVDVRWNSRIVRDEFRVIGTEGEMNLTPLNGPELRYGDRVELLLSRNSNRALSDG